MSQSPSQFDISSVNGAHGNVIVDVTIPRRSLEMTPGLKPFTVFILLFLFNFPRDKYPKST